MDKYFISVADPSSKTISGHKCPCNIQSPSSEIREAEGTVLAISLNTSMLTFTSPLKENKDTTRWSQFQGLSFFLSAVIVVTGLSGSMNSTLPAPLNNLLYDY